MVESIKSSDGKIIIITKPQSKSKTEKSKDGDFGKIVDEKSGSEDTEKSSGSAKSSPLRSPEPNPILQNRQLAGRMQKLEVLAQQIRDGTYKLVDPAVLADCLLKAAFDPQTRSKFLKKFVSDEMEQAKSKGRSALSKLELKRLLQIAKQSPDEVFNDPELDSLMEELV
ncbi:MAG: hypothetical protein HQM08_12800 [Candidatus Riflebacteria bacterium]|nr:hypothetical protein [Candidatus Riflebacteria bacterium]